MERKIHYGWITLFVGTIIVFAAMGLARFGYTMILPTMQEGLHLNNTQAGAIATGNFIGYLTLAIIGGFLASHFSPRRVIFISLCVVGIGMVMTGTATSFHSAFFWRLVTGLGSGGCFVPTMGLISGWFSSSKRGFATGFAIGGSSLGLISTGIMAPHIVEKFGIQGWRYYWIAMGTAALLTAVAAYFTLLNKPQDKSLQPVGNYPNGSENGNNAEHHYSYPWSAIYKSRTVWLLAAAYMSFGFSYIMYVTFFAKYLQSEIGLPKKTVGNYWQAVGWISIFCGITWGWISDTIGRKNGLALLCFVQGCSYLIFALLPTKNGILISIVIFGITSWSTPALMASACADHLGTKMASATLGFITFFFGIGQAAGPAVAGKIADASGSFSNAFLLAAFAAWIGAITALFIRKTEHNPMRHVK